jgi:hypothetical protein
MTVADEDQMAEDFVRSGHFLFVEPLLIRNSLASQGIL